MVVVSDVSRQRGEGNNEIWIDWSGLDEMLMELCETAGLLLQHHHRQTWRPIDSLAGPGKHGRENYDLKLL